MAEEGLNAELADIVRGLKDERGRCPSESDLVEYHSRPIQDRRGHAVDAHVQICSRCQLVLLHLDEPAVHTPAFRWQWAAAAALLLAIALPVMYQSTVNEAPPETIRGSDIQPIAPAGQVTAVEFFEWQSPVQPARYRVRVYRGSDEIWTSTSETTRLPVAGAVPLEPDALYTWTVEAIDAAGDVRLSSPSQTFSLAR